MLWLVSVAQADPAVDAEQATLRIALADEPPNLDSVLATDQISSFMLLHTNEGLTRYGPDGRLQGAVAERWELSGERARFWLRDDARWEDGRPVTADDFVFAWRRLVDPVSAAQYASLIYPIRNARAVNEGRLPVSALGVRAVSARELVVEFDTPCPWFLGLTAFTTMLPQRADIVAEQGSRYAADVGRMLSNGPFRLTRWVHGASLLMERNATFREADRVRLARIEVPHMVRDAGARMNLFLDGEIAMAPVTQDQVRQVLDRRQHLKRFVDGGLMYLNLNQREGRLTRNRALRKAIQAAVNPDELVYKVLRQPGLVPTDSLFPSMLRVGDQAFTTVYPPPSVSRDLETARRWLTQARAELGAALDEPIHLLVGDSPSMVKAAEYFQARLALLGLEVRIDRQILKLWLQKGHRGEFDVVLAGWFPDYDDPMTFADLFVSWNPNNRGRYASDEYDQLITTATQELDPDTRNRAFDRMQALLVEEAPMIPLFQSAVLYVQNPGLKGVVRTPFAGDPILRYAWLE